MLGERPAGIADYALKFQPEHSLLLPHDEFAFAELKSQGKEQTTPTGFAMHEVAGSRLLLARRIETTMQRMELSFLAQLPSSQRSLITDGQPVILEIVVTESKEADQGAQEIQE